MPSAGSIAGECSGLPAPNYSAWKMETNGWLRTINSASAESSKVGRARNGKASSIKARGAVTLFEKPAMRAFFCNQRIFLVGAGILLGRNTLDDWNLLWSFSTHDSNTVCAHPGIEIIGRHLLAILRHVKTIAAAVGSCRPGGSSSARRNVMTCNKISDAYAILQNRFTRYCHFHHRHVFQID